jgi:hypothetical protein
LGAEKKAMKEEEEEEKEKQQQGPKSQSVPSGHLAGANVFEKPAETVSPVAQTDLRLNRSNFLRNFLFTSDPIPPIGFDFRICRQC